MASRKALDPTVKLKVWVRCGGRCAICNKYLLEDGLVGREVTVGELAHIIGQANTENSPRGISTTPEEERNDANNLVLICPNDHTAIDRKQLGDVMTVELVKGLKQRHERRIRQATELASSKDTVIVRLVGDVAGTAVELTRERTGAAALAAGDRFPTYPFSYDQTSVEIDLRNLPNPGSDTYFTTACQMIDALFDGPLGHGIATNQIEHLSIFGFARIPLLVYLGSKLDDGIDVALFQRQRVSGEWEWVGKRSVAYTTTAHNHSERATDIVVLVSISAPISRDEIPSHLSECPVLEIRPKSAGQDTNRFKSKAELASFSEEYRAMLGRIERDYKPHAERIHLIAAAPIAAAIEMGRLRDPNSHPGVVVYQRDGGSGGERYTAAVTIT